MYTRPIYNTLIRRVSGPRRFMQVLAGPRQVGKTTLAGQLIAAQALPVHYVSADDPALKGSAWIEQQWKIGRAKMNEGGTSELGALLILDEIQKLPEWSEVVKKLWDQDTMSKTNLKVMLLGSSTLLINQGLTESLTGRFELVPITHWSYSECLDAFGWTLQQFIYFGGYPGSASLINDEVRWKNYILNSIIETSISRDIMLMTRVNKPALLRRLFELGCAYSGQILSYQKMLGQLQDTGNTTTLANYLDLLHEAGLLVGLQKFSPVPLPQKASSPKLQVLNTALISAQAHNSFEQTTQDGSSWGRLVESVIGAYLVSAVQGTVLKVWYWRDGNKEVDFVLTNGSEVMAIEVKSGRTPTTLPGMEAFSRQFNPKTKLLVGEGGIPIEEFLTKRPAEWF